MIPSILRIALLLAFLSGCTSGDEDPLLTLLPSSETGVDFSNEIVEREGLNVLTYEYFYNGGGVAVGDVSGDGLPDIYLTANMTPNALYVNEGNMRFRDRTAAAGVQGGQGWKTGVAMADVNADGLLDIYVCKSGRVSEPLRRNELYINNGDLTFTERAAEFGLDDPSYSTHASFFDYDRDGDLDMFLVNHAVERYSRFDVELMKAMRDPLAGDKLYRNDGGRFTDVTRESGIFANPIGFGLSAVTADVNDDGWTDIFVANDYVEDDYLYINRGDGTFSEELRLRFGHTSYSSMGSDIADVNNDGFLDVYTLDMMPEDPVRRKLLQGPNDYVRYSAMLQEGYYRQFMRNMLQLNNGNGTFSEIGQLAGVAETDWSWAALLADLDNDGWKDLFITNGYLRDYTNMDFLMSVLQDSLRKARVSGRPLDADAVAAQMPQTEISNYVFKNTNGLVFEKRSEAWGVAQPAFSNGAAYGDLDADGDLDLVVNNINRPAFIYRNESAGHRYLSVRLEGEPANRFGTGARVDVIAPDGRTFTQHQQPSRGYLSSVEPILHFGLGDVTTVEIQVTWPDGTTGRARNLQTNRRITLIKPRTPPYPEPRTPYPVPPTPYPEPRTPYPVPLFLPIADRLGLDFLHQEDAFVDFEREPLLPHMLSRQGPALASADINGDGLDDVFFGGARGQSAALYLQGPAGSFERLLVAAFDTDAEFEDVAAAFFDADGDNDADLYVVSGGTHAAGESPAYQDRLYLNTGFGRLEKSDVLPQIPSSGSVVAPHDFDGDGDADLFVGGGVSPGRYPTASRSYLIENRGGRFVDATPEALRTPGMVAAAAWIDSDTGPRLFISGEWMPIRAFDVTGERVEEVTDRIGLEKTEGWWNVLAADDLDGDGDPDLIAGNRGLNHALQASERDPLVLFADDFGRDGTIDPILTYTFEGKRYPVAWRDELLAQIPALHRSYPDYASYARATVEQIFTQEQLKDATRFVAHEFATCVFENREGRMVKHELPLESQFAPTNAVLTIDIDRDGLKDLVLAGNNFGARAQWGDYTAGRGALLLNLGGFAFKALSPSESGFFAPGDARRLDLVQTQLGSLLIVANNDSRPHAFGVNYTAADATLASSSSR